MTKEQCWMSPGHYLSHNIFILKYCCNNWRPKCNAFCMCPGNRIVTIKFLNCVLSDEGWSSMQYYGASFQQIWCSFRIFERRTVAIWPRHLCFPEGVVWRCSTPLPDHRENSKGLLLIQQSWNLEAMVSMKSNVFWNESESNWPVRAMGVV